MPGDVRPILAVGRYGGGSIHKPSTIKVGEHSPAGGVICGAQVGKMAFRGAFYAFVGIGLVHAGVCVGIAVVLALGWGGCASLGAAIIICSRTAIISTSIISSKRIVAQVGKPRVRNYY